MGAQHAHPQAQGAEHDGHRSRGRLSAARGAHRPQRFVAARRRRWLETHQELPLAIEVATRMVDRTSRLFVWVLAISLGASLLEFPEPGERVLKIVLVSVFWFQVGLWGIAAVRQLVDRRSPRAARLDPALAGALDIIAFIANLAIWSMVFLRFNVPYNTPLPLLRAIPGIIREIIEAQPQTRFDRCHFMSFADWALQFEVVYYMTTADYTAYADTQQAVNLAIVERFKERGIEFALPSRPLYPEKPPAA